MAGDSGKANAIRAKDLSPTDKAIGRQLSDILASPDFKGKDTLSNFLRFIVEETLAGHAHQIKGFTIATQVLGRRDNFDAVRDPTVRILAGKLRSALEHYYLTLGRRDPVRIEVPRGTYVPVFSHHPGPDQREGLSPQLGKESAGISMHHGPSIAVMPFVSLSGDPEREHFADGLTEELTTEIARYQDLRVVARHSTMKFKGVRVSAGELGRELNVRFLLEGSVRRDGDRVKIAVQLVDTSTQMQIWGEQYRRDLSVGHLIEAQEEIAAKVAASIGGYSGVIPRRLSKESRGRPPEVLEEYDAFLRLHRYSLSPSQETFSEALDALEHAHRRDPDSGVVWAMLANLYADNNTLWFRDIDAPMEKALAYARRAVSLEPQNQYVHTILALLSFLIDERAVFFREAELVIELNPNSPTHTAFMGWAMALYGEWDRGMPILKNGMALNPHYPGYFHLAHYAYFLNKEQVKQAWREAQRILSPGLFWDPLLRAAALGHLGRSAQARAAAAELLRMKPDFQHHAQKLVAFYFKPKALVDKVLEGLRKAGLVIAHGTTP